MKICMMTSVYALSEKDRNGSFLVECNRYMAEQGHQIQVFAPSYNGLKSHEVQGIPVYRFRYFIKHFENLTHFQGAPNRIRNPFYLFVAFFYILSGIFNALALCRREKYDVIHVHWPFPHGLWGYFAARIHNTPVILTFHGAELLLSKKFPFVKYFLRHAIKHARMIICNSRYTASELQKICPVHESKIHVIPFGATVNIRPTEKEKDKKVKDILYVGRLIERKGVKFLIEAFKEIAEKTPSHLHIVGDGDRAEVLKNLVQSLDLRDKVTFHGVVSNEQLENLYQKADVFVLPSIVDDRGDTEGLGIVLVEALGFHTPVVACDVGGISDVIENGKTGWLVPEKNPEAIASAVLRVFADPLSASNLVEEGAVRAQSYFDWNRIIAQILGLYSSVL
jgi:glycosyltransferase involved in cell wall biosynthesis